MTLTTEQRKRNTLGLHRHAQNKAEATRQRAEAAISHLIKEQRPTADQFQIRRRDSGDLNRLALWQRGTQATDYPFANATDSSCAGKNSSSGTGIKRIEGYHDCSAPKACQRAIGGDQGSQEAARGGLRGTVPTVALRREYISDVSDEVPSSFIKRRSRFLWNDPGGPRKTTSRAVVSRPVGRNESSVVAQAPRN